MIRVNSRVTLNMQAMKRLTEAQAMALEMTAENLHTEVVQAQVIPRDTGVLQNDRTHIRAGESVESEYKTKDGKKKGKKVINSITKEKNGTVSIITVAPQARRLYYHPEYHFSKKENPNAKGHWFEDWEEGGDQADLAIETYKKIYRRLTGL